MSEATTDLLRIIDRSATATENHFYALRDALYGMQEVFRQQDTRIAALEAARAPADTTPAPAPETGTVTISRAQWERLANEVEFWMTESVAMANAITDDTVVRFQNARNSIIHIIKEVDPTF